MTRLILAHGSHRLLLGVCRLSQICASMRLNIAISISTKLVSNTCCGLVRSNEGPQMLLEGKLAKKELI